MPSTLTPIIPAMYEAVEDLARLLRDSSSLTETVDDFVTIQHPNPELGLTVEVEVRRARAAIRVTSLIGRFQLSATGKMSNCAACCGLMRVPVHLTDDPRTATLWRDCFRCRFEVRPPASSPSDEAV